MLRGEGQQKIRGGLRPAKALRTYVKGGFTVVDLVDVDGNVWLACRVVSQGGGRGRFLHVPPVAAGQDKTTPADTSVGDLVIAFTDGGVPHPLVVGVVQAREAAGRFATLDDPGQLARYPAQNDVRDIVIENGGGRFVVSTFGRVLAVAGGTQPIVLEVSPASFVWLSQEDTDADAAERLPLAGPTRAYLDARTEQLNALETKVALLQNTIVTAVASPDYVGFQGVLTPVVKKTTATTGAKTDESMVASAVRISPRSQAEE